MLYRAILLLSTSFFLAMDGTMAQYSSGAVSYRINTEGTAPTLTSYLYVSFYHDQGSGPYEPSYYLLGELGCGDAITSEPGITDATATSDSTPDGDPADLKNSCGVNNNAPCAKKTTYRFTLQSLNAITNPSIKSIDNNTPPPKTTVKFCVRNSLKDTSSNLVLGFKTAALKLEWTTDSSFDNAVVTNEDGPDDVNIDVGDITAEARLCSDLTPSAIPTTYEQGQKIQICIWAEIKNPADASVVIVDVHQFYFWIDTDNDGILDVSETNQFGITIQTTTSSITTGATVLTPATAINGGGGICNTQFAAPNPGTTYIAGSTQKGCVLTTFLSAPFFKPADTTVKYAGIVTIQFSNGNRRSLALKSGDKFAKPFTSVVTTVTRATEDDSCECGGFFFLICMIMCFISSLFG